MIKWSRTHDHDCRSVFQQKKKLFSIFFLCAYYRGSHRTCSAKKAVLKDFTFFAGKRVYWRLQHACFPVNIAKERLFCRRSANGSFCYQSLDCFLALHSFKLTKHSHFSIFTTLHGNSATKIKHGDVSYNSNFSII